MTTDAKRKGQKAVEEMGGASRIHEEIIAFSDRVERLDAKWKNLIKKYPDKWVAMADSEIIAIADTLEDVLREIDKRGVQRAEVVVEFLDTDPQSFIL